MKHHTRRPASQAEHAIPASLCQKQIFLQSVEREKPSRFCETYIGGMCAWSLTPLHLNQNKTSLRDVFSYLFPLQHHGLCGSIVVFRRLAKPSRASLTNLFRIRISIASTWVLYKQLGEVGGLHQLTSPCQLCLHRTSTKLTKN